MSVVKSGPEWWPSYAVLVLYMILAFVLTFWPLESFPVLLDVKGLPLVSRLMENSSYPARIEFYWHWMMFMFPIVLFSFSLLTPYKVDADKVMSPFVIPGSVFLMMLFGSFTVALFWIIFYLKTDIPVGSLGRIVEGSANHRIDLCMSGIFIMVPLCLIAWLSFVLIPVGIFKIRKIRSEIFLDSRICK